MLNDANNPFNQRGRSKLGTDLAKAMGTDVHMNRSWQWFVAAMNEGQRTLAAAAPNFGK